MAQELWFRCAVVGDLLPGSRILGLGRLMCGLLLLLLCMQIRGSAMLRFGKASCLTRLLVRWGKSYIYLSLSLSHGRESQLLVGWFGLGAGVSKIQSIIIGIYTRTRL
ncbi:hypothetical protein N658DRAFT_144105 [Parathielavia hyrcaniae]|uniref:Uncharacterized protein n=1 Tax=Parathielavia hyrcaniae TaxID=113614 RepID=A0AAN6Q0F4_9PEZI|nr:hypothetical protein N658DRAFT_144105 [Parathielavia hyrcaniae]